MANCTLYNGSSVPVSKYIWRMRLPIISYLVYWEMRCISTPRLHLRPYRRQHLHKLLSLHENRAHDLLHNHTHRPHPQNLHYQHIPKEPMMSPTTFLDALLALPTLYQVMVSRRAGRRCVCRADPWLGRAAAPDEYRRRYRAGRLGAR